MEIPRTVIGQDNKEDENHNSRGRRTKNEITA